MKPRFSSSVVTTESFAKQVFHCSEDEWRRLPPQMRGFILHRQDKGLTPGIVLEGMDAGRFSSVYDPQGTFDAFQGLQPA
jgi:hypothetical protein